MGNFGFQELLLLGFVVAILVPGIFFLIELQNALQTIDIGYRKIVPGNVWLLLIPLFNLVYIFIVVNAIADGFQKQLTFYGTYGNEKPTFYIGLAWGVSIICGRLPVVGPFITLAGLILWIVYWIKVYNIRKQLQFLRQSFNSEEKTSIFNDHNV